MPITRRQFLMRSGLGAGGLLIGPGLFGSPLVRRAFADIGSRYLVVFYLDGGNDGLNTIVPYDNVGGLRAFYEAHRLAGTGGLRIAPAALSVPTLPCEDPNTGAQLGFHPGLAGLRALYDAGMVAVIQGCGYPDYSLSHADSTTIWQTANPLGLGAFDGTGWVGRHLALEYGNTAIPGVNIANSVAGEFRQTATGVLAMRRVADAGFPYDDYDPLDQGAKRDAFEALYTAANGATNPLMSFLGGTGLATLIGSESYPPLHGAYTADRATWNQLYSNIGRSLARDLREVAKIIYGIENAAPSVTARFFQVSNGGYDTHSDQGGAEIDGQHYDLHKEVGDSLKVFYDDLADMGVADKVCTVVWSEFSRRIPQNSNGTDHGSQGPMFVIGGAVQGGVYGNHPNIDPGALDDNENTPYSQVAADPFRSTDFRDVYGTVLKHWLNMSATTILSSVLPLDVGSPADYWTVANFDLDFLP